MHGLMVPHGPLPTTFCRAPIPRPSHLLSAPMQRSALQPNAHSLASEATSRLMEAHSASTSAALHCTGTAGAAGGAGGAGGGGGGIGFIGPAEATGSIEKTGAAESVSAEGSVVSVATAIASVAGVAPSV